MIALFRAGRFAFDKLLRFYRFDDINVTVEDVIAGKTIDAVLRLV